MKIKCELVLEYYPMDTVIRTEEELAYDFVEALGERVLGQLDKKYVLPLSIRVETFTKVTEKETR